MAPRNMLAVPIPSAPNLSNPLTHALRQAISSHAADTHHPDAFASDIASFVQLRASVGAMEEHFASLEYAYKYHAQLTFAATKLPSPLPLAFPWSQPLVSTSVFAFGASSGAAPASYVTSATESTSELAGLWSRNDRFGLVYDGEAYVGHSTLAWEKANVLFAAAALLSSLAIQEPRNDGQSIKRAVGFFQTSSAIFSHLVSVVGPVLLPQLDLTSPPHGLSAARLRPLATLTLAQAQECFWQKAVSDGMKPGTVAKLAKAVEDLYEQAIDEARQAEVEDGVEAFPRLWLNHITVKRHHFAAAAQFRKSQEDLANSRYGDEIARLQLAETHVKTALGAAKKSLPSSSEAVTSDLRGLQGIIDSNLKRARKDNDLIYLEPVTTSGSLAAIQGARMVAAKLPIEIARPIDCLRPTNGSSASSSSRSMGVTTSGDATLPALGKPLFGALVPYGAHVAVSVYEDRKDTWWRERIEAKRQELEGVVKSTLDSLNLPGTLDDLDQPQSVIPQSLLSRAEQLAHRGGVAELQRLRSEVERIAALNGSILDEARSILDSESSEDATVRQQFAQSKHWTREESNVASRRYRARLDELAGTVQMAADSDATVRSKIERWTPTWQTLEGGEPAIRDSLPAPVGVGRDEGGDGKPITGSSPVVRQLRRSLEEVDDALSEFAALATESRSLARADDIRDKVMREVARLSAGEQSSGAGTPDGAIDDVDLSPEMFESLFEVEFKKYRILETEATSLERKIESLIERIGAGNDAFRSQLAASSPSKAKLSAHVADLEAAAAKYQEVLSNLTEGLNFYNSLAPINREFQQSCQEWSRARSIDIQSLVQQFAGTSLEIKQKPWEASSGAAGASAANTPRRSTQHPATSPAAASTPRRSARNNAKATPTTTSTATADNSNTPQKRSSSTRTKKTQQNVISARDDDEEDDTEDQGGEAEAADETAVRNGLTGETQGQAPQWGAWSGGQIRFGDS